MPPSLRPTLPCLLLGTILPVVAPAAAADLPVSSSPRSIYGAETQGGGFHVARVPVRPAPLRYDIYGYPLRPGVPSPLVVGSGCPAALQPDYDSDGNFAGYAPIPMCR